MVSITASAIAIAKTRVENDKAAIFQWVQKNFDGIDDDWTRDKDGYIGAEDIEGYTDFRNEPGAGPNGNRINMANVAIVFESNDPENALFDSVKKDANVSGQPYLSESDINKAIVARSDLQKKELYEWILKNFTNINQAAGGNGDNNSDSWISAWDVEAWSKGM